MNHKCEWGGKIKAIFFDLDGTLIDSDRAVYCAIIKVMNFLQIPIQKNISPQKAMQYSGRSLVDFMNAFVEEPYRSQETLEKIYRTIPHIYNRKIFEKEITVYEGIKDILEHFKSQGIHLAVISNSTQQVVEEICSCFFDGLFDFIYGDQDGKHAKPDPIGILAALNAFQLSPQEALYIGDTMVDALTAKAAGVFMVGAMWGKTEANSILRQSQSCPVVETPSELINYVLT